VKKESRIAERRAQLEREKIKHEADELAAKTTTQKRKIEQQQQEAVLQGDIEILDAEINEILASRNEELQRGRVMIDEFGAGFTTRRRERIANLEQLDDEIAKREKQLAEQLNALEKQHSREQEELNNEVKATNDRLQKLQQLFAKMERKNNRELQLTQRDVDKLAEAVHEAEVGEKQQLEDTRKQMAQLEEAQRESIEIEQNLAAMRQEIAQIKKDNQDMRKERQRLDTLIYSTRLSKHRSTFH
jgi:DNA repair exonuclease SbcCD ATPase subunit